MDFALYTDIRESKVMVQTGGMCSSLDVVAADFNTMVELRFCNRPGISGIAESTLKFSIRTSFQEVS